MIGDRLVWTLLPALLLTACSGGASRSMDGALREAFPEQAAEVLDRGQGFQEGPAGFVPSALGAWAGVSAELPHDASGEVVLRAGGGVEVRVREVGASGPGVVARKAVAYPRRRGASFWTAAGAGVEEWIQAEPGEAAAGGSLAAWDVEGAALRQRGEGVEIVDGAGRARIVVTAPRAFGAGGRPIDARLEVRGARIDLLVEPTQDAVLVDPAWSAVPSMSTTRGGPTSAFLPSTGKALVAGGIANGGGCIGEQRSSIFYDPVANAWTASASMPVEPHLYGLMSLLPTGKVLLAGGLDCNTESTTVELYDPGSDSWSTAAPMLSAGLPVGVALQTGEVLIAGSADPTSAAVYPDVQKYAPVQNTWTNVAPLKLARSLHTATLLQDGRVLVAGGYDYVAMTVFDECEIYDPSSDTWTVVASMSSPRYDHAAVLLQSTHTSLDGKVLVAGGTLDAADTIELATTEIYDPAANTWTAGPPLAQAYTPNALTPLGDGTVLTSGGWGDVAPTTDTERFDPVSVRWVPATPIPGAAAFPATVLLPDGSVLLAGGADDAFDDIVAAAYRFTLVPQGGACNVAGDCASLSCVQGVCCDSACQDQCHACAQAQGASADGTCTPLTGPACGDGKACTITAACMVGTCTATSSVTCTSLDPCHPGACDPTTGVCQFPAAPNGTPCDDHDACTATDTCQGGLCIGTSPKVCQAQDDCHDAVCDPATAACKQQDKPDGAPCDDHDACTLDDTCHSGACVGGAAVVCVARDSCHAAGVCDPVTGCTNPVLPVCNGMAPPSQGALANGNLCSGDGDCTSSHCARGVCCDSACTDKCFSCALPATRGTCTPEPEGIDLNGDCGVGPNCVSTCAPGGGSCTGAMAGTQCLPARCVDDHTLLGPAICPSEGAPCPETQSVPLDCAPYACQAAFGACATACRNVADCAPGFVCESDHTCRRPPDVAGGSDGCHHAPGPPDGASPAWLLLALTATRRRPSCRQRRLACR